MLCAKQQIWQTTIWWFVTSSFVFRNLSGFGNRRGCVVFFLVRGVLVWRLLFARVQVCTYDNDPLLSSSNLDLLFCSSDSNEIGWNDRRVSYYSNVIAPTKQRIDCIPVFCGPWARPFLLSSWIQIYSGSRWIYVCAAPITFPSSEPGFLSFLSIWSVFSRKFIRSCEEGFEFN